MISKELLSHSLKSAYKDMLLAKSVNESKMKSEILRLVSDASVFTETEIAEHMETFRLMERLSNKNKVCCHIDGSVRIVYANPEAKTGKEIAGAGASYIIESDGDVLAEQSVALPTVFMNNEMTSHIAEYHALLECLRALSCHYANPEELDIEIESDSEVLCNQMSYSVRTRNARHQKLKEQSWDYIRLFHSVTFKKIPREENKWADRLARASYSNQP